MSSLYSRLFTYREREGLSPLENFLTEALADLLSRMPEDYVRALIADLFDLSDLTSVWPLGAQGKWVTQRAIEGGRILDILFEVKGSPVLIIENKIGSGFQNHGPAAESNQESHQLETYGRWLHRHAEPSWGGALVLLTHLTPPPIDFVVAGEKYGCKYRSVVRWSALSRWISRHADTVEGEPPAWVSLSYELTDFLKEKRMDSELATSHDLAALQIYVSSADRVRNTVEQMWYESRDIWRSLCQQTDVPLEVSTQWGCIWKFRYLARTDLRSSYLAVGIRYPSVGQHPSNSEPSGGGYLFVEVGSDDEKSPVDDLRLPENWSESQALRIARRPLNDLPSDAESFASEGQQWVRERIREVADLLA